MARFRRGPRPIINSIKHVFDSSQTLVAGTQLNTLVNDAVQAPNLTIPAQTAIGGKVFAIYLRVEIASTEDVVGGIPNAYLMVWKNVGTNLTAPTASSVGTNDNKRWVLHQEMVMLENKAGGNPRTLFNGVIKIPKGMQRQGNDDSLQVSVVAPIINTALCIQCIFKEYR